MFKVANLNSPLFKEVTLQIKPGECISINGQSGSGKTVFLRALADLDPSSGTIHLNSVERRAMDAPEWRRKVRYIAAEPGFWAAKVGDHFTRPDNSLAIMTLLNMPIEAADWQIERLSTGEKQRTGLAIALADDPPVILADEPTSALDLETASLVETLFRKRLADGAALVLVSHDRTFANRLADRHFVVENGTITEAGP